MDPQVRSFLAAVNSAKQPPIDQVPIEETRRQFNSLTPIFHPHVEVGRVSDITTESGVLLRAYHPVSASSEPLPGIVYFHGGGWVMGSLSTHDTLCRHLANHSGCVVVSVDYRLSPEHPFPMPLDDACSATQYVLDHSVELGVDGNKIGVMGDSAGGNLALAVAVKARDEQRTNLTGQCLLYPVLDSRCDSESYGNYGDEHGLTKAKMLFFWNAYLGGSDPDDPLASPTFLNDLTNLPPTMVLTAEFDVLRDEGAALARRLTDSGNRVEYKCSEGMIHGFIHFAGAIERGRVELANVGRRFGELLRGKPDS